jgi:serine protease inhibitor
MASEKKQADKSGSMAIGLSVALLLVGIAAGFGLAYFWLLRPPATTASSPDPKLSPSGSDSEPDRKLKEAAQELVNARAKAKDLTDKTKGLEEKIKGLEDKMKEADGKVKAANTARGQAEKERDQFKPAADKLKTAETAEQRYRNLLRSREAELFAARRKNTQMTPLDPSLAKALPESSRAFATDLFAAITKVDKPDRNVAISPYSISSALGMALAGARGETAKEIASVLHLSVSDEKLHSAIGGSWLARVTPAPSSPASLPQSLGVEIGEDRVGDVKVEQVHPGSPAQLAGISPGDRIRKIDGRDVKTAVDFTNLIQRAKATVEIRFLQVLSGRILTKTIRLNGAAATDESQRREVMSSLLTANSIWGDKSVEFLPNFTELVESNYDARIAMEDFAKDPGGAGQRINEWIAGKTNGRLKEALPPGTLTSRTRLVLSSAVYFKASWAKPFEKENTTEGPFRVAANKQVSAPLMTQTGEFRHFRSGDGFQLLELPYKGDAFSMIVLLPDTVGGIGDLERSVARADLPKLLQGLQARYVQVTIPRFRIESALDLNKALSDLGMPSAFSEKADFSGMSAQRDLYLQAVRHTTFVDVDELGTEAAATTTEVVSARRKPDVEFLADRPFLFFIRDNLTNTILFFGRVVNPKPGES